MARRYRGSPLVGIIALIIGFIWTKSQIPSSGSNAITSETQAFFNKLYQPYIPLFWILIPVFIIGLIIYVIYQINHYYQLSKAGIFEIDKMSGQEFEEKLLNLYSRLGYSVQHTGKTGDFGVDLILEKNGKRIAVQAKCWNETVKERAIQEVVGSKAVHNCSEAWVVTNNEFTPKARILAKANGVKLVNRENLIKDLLAQQQMNTTKYPKIEHEIKPLEQKSTTVQYDSKLNEYISSQIATGEKWPDIKTRLIQAGWNESDLDEAYLKINNSNPTVKAEQNTKVEQETNSGEV